MIFKKHISVKSILTLFGVCFYFFTSANNVKVKWISHKDTYNIGIIEVAWDNAWRYDTLEPNNNDAVWIFAKYRNKYEYNWRHLDLTLDKFDPTLSQNLLNYRIHPNKKGIMVWPKNIGDYETIADRIPLPYHQNINLKDIAEISLHAIEMVYVPNGNFYVGDGRSNNTLAAKNNLPLLVNSDTLLFRDTGKYDPKVVLPSTFPNGYQEFYIMKYEITQQQFLDLLNSLTQIQQENLISTSIYSNTGKSALSSTFSNRNGIALERPSYNAVPAQYGLDLNQNGIYNEDVDGATIACNFLNHQMIFAYLDWAALRPITELEFEKACRGPKQPIEQEFAWGTNLAVDAKTIINAGLNIESVLEKGSLNEGLSNQNYSPFQSPLRTGFASTKDNVSRVAAGAGYYGALDLTGNLWELCLALHHNNSFEFSNQSGDGILDNNGFSNEKGWNTIVTIYRGGGYNSGVSSTYRDGAVSDRFYADLEPNLKRATSGGRGGLSW